MARAIGANVDEMWRAVLVFKLVDGTLRYAYEGLYAKKSTAQGEVTRNSKNPYFYNGWVERCEFIWHKVQD